MKKKTNFDLKALTELNIMQFHVPQMVIIPKEIMALSVQ